MQITIEGGPLFAHKTRLKHVSLVTARTSIWKKTQNLGRTGRLVVCSQSVGSFSTLNEKDIDFRVSGLPHAVVKQAENSRVRELVKKIENHPYRQALQEDLQQDDAYNPFSEKSPRRRLRTWAMLSYWSCSRQILKCNAKSAMCTGVKASSIALAGIS